MSIEYTDANLVDGAHDLTPAEKALLELAERLFDPSDYGDPVTRRRKFAERWFAAQRYRR